jgi:citrate synthase
MNEPSVTVATGGTTETLKKFRPGLEGVVAAETALSHVDGTRGVLLIGGYPVEEIAPQAAFEEVVHLLWQGTRATEREVASLRQALAAQRALPAATVALLERVAAARKSPMDALRIAAGTLDLDAPDKEWDGLALRLVARMPTVVATYWRLLHGLTPVEPDAGLGDTANYLYMLTGEMPEDAKVRGLETYLNTVSDHGLNASTFAARVIIATQSDLVSAIVGAIGALKGPLHGGAPGPALDMVFEIGRPEAAEAYLRAKLERGERLMGFGHRVYKVRDPRAEVLAAAAAEMFAADVAGQELYGLAKSVEATAIRLLEEYKPGRRLQTNVEFFTALLLHGLGLESALFTPTFAVGRTVGWIAHCREQMATNRLIRPEARYVGPVYTTW